MTRATASMSSGWGRKIASVAVGVCHLCQSAPTGGAHAAAGAAPARCACALSGRAPNWLDRLAAEHLPVPKLSDALNHLYGAYNTVDFVIAAALFELSRHPEWRARIRTELDTVLGERQYASLDDVPRLPLLWGVIKETLRLYPVTTGIIRQTGAPPELEGERIPTGTQVVVVPYALHRHPDYWEDPRPSDRIAGDALRSHLRIFRSSLGLVNAWARPWPSSNCWCASRPSSATPT